MVEPADPVALFVARRSDYKKISNYVHDIIVDHCNFGAIQSSEWRAKSIESFSKKCEKKFEGELKYKDPLKELTDLGGVRFIVYTQEQVETICKNIRDNFIVDEEIDVGERKYKEGRFGYQSKHLIVRLTKQRADLIENRRIADLCCEVQVRTLIQHAWAAIEHKIQYKRDSEIPLALSRRFSALAGALELADRELQSIEADSRELRDSIQEELEKSVTLEKLSEEPAATNDQAVGEEDSAQTDVRQLVRAGKYLEAENIYSAKIRVQPKSATLYIGRAKVRFLSGDTVGAIEDLDKHDGLRKNDPASVRLREIIITGAKSEVIPPTNLDYSDRVRLAEAALRNGEGGEAFAMYNNLETDGYNKAFALFGMAMACALRRDFDEAHVFLSRLSIRPGTPMAINICALFYVIFSMTQTPQTYMTKKLHDMLAAFEGFDLTYAPIRHFLDGCAALGYESHILKVRAILLGEAGAT